MSEIFIDNREAERQRIEQLEREQREAEDARIKQEEENAKELQSENFSLDEGLYTGRDESIEALNDSASQLNSLEENRLPDDNFDFLETDSFSLDADGVAISESYFDAKETDYSEKKSDEVKFDEATQDIYKEKYPDCTPAQIETHKALDSLQKPYAGKELTNDDRTKLSEDTHSCIENKPYEERNDARSYRDSTIKRVSLNPDGTTTIEFNYRDGSDGAKEGTEHSEVLQKGTIIDRFGSSNGRYASPLKEDGTVYTIKERGLADRPIEPRIEDNAAYHRYEINQDLSKDNLQRAIDEYYPGAKDRIVEKDDGQVQIDVEDMDAVDYFLSKRDLDKYYEDPTKQQYFDENSEGIKTSTADIMFGDEDDPDGGAKQYEFPWSIKELETYGLVTELEDYE